MTTLPPNDLTEILKAGLRPTPDHVAQEMKAIVRPADRPGYLEYVKPDTGVVVAVVPKEPGKCS